MDASTFQAAFQDFAKNCVFERKDLDIETYVEFGQLWKEVASQGLGRQEALARCRKLFARDSRLLAELRRLLLKGWLPRAGLSHQNDLTSNIEPLHEARLNILDYATLDTDRATDSGLAQVGYCLTDIINTLGGFTHRKMSEEGCVTPSHPDLTQILYAGQDVRMLIL
ncbi:hypothetical protein Tdes44962_MAKER06448 [Teratosphaeria destructans]|uniref:Uncharacterized protein n=1 Tax=Teratosphaeria destructans TaxID=418781 RepID=A0A9W7W713_9PEZI|nr:hypothetical protein Tdes44962_MAKER06448 [Teratosphaeria destructans]